ncbi:MAG: HAD family hydrolase [Candidatus Eisenbacteria bacterium]
MRASRWAVFLDRDGTIIEETGYLSDPEKVRLIEGAASSVAELNRRGVPVVVVSNQAGVARGLVTNRDLQTVNRRMSELLSAGGASLDAMYFCPHHPEYDRQCDCRKPQPGLILRAAKELSIDLARSFMVGDRLIDMQAGRSAGTATVFLRTGYGEKELSENREEVPRIADKICDDLREAVGWILSERSEE